MRMPHRALPAILLLPCHAFPACPGSGTPLPPLLKPGPIADRWFDLKCDGGIGNPIGPERRHLWSGGIYQDFERGQITVHPRWAGDPSAKMGNFVLSAYSTGKTIQIKWQDTAPYSYDFFQVRWDIDNHAKAIEKQHEETGGFLGIGGEDPQQKKVEGSKTKGETSIPAGAGGTYVISVEGCDDAGFLSLGSDCNQGWSFPVEVDQFLVTLPALPPVYPSTGSLTAPPYDLLDGPMLHPKQIAEILKSACENPQNMIESEGGHKGELRTGVALAALRSIRDTSAALDPEVQCAELGEGKPPKLRTRSQLLALVNAKIKESEVNSQPGTDDGTLKGIVGGIFGLPAGGLTGGIIGFLLGGPGGAALGAKLGAVFGAAAGFITGPEIFDAGDYDMRLVGLVQIAYLYGDLLDDGVMKRLVDELLTVRGDASKRREHVYVAGIKTPVPESENHILMTESSRYLTNQLLAQRYKKDGKPVPKEFDNDQNGMNDWMLKHLQSFLQQDFFEYNARPYTFQAMQGISNLYEFAGPTLLSNPCWQSQSIPTVPPIPRACHVRRGARIVMDYNAARFALAALGLRRASPNRRQPEQKDYTRLLGRQSDSATWRYLALTGGTDLFWKNRYGRLAGSVQGDMLTPIVGFYRVPRLIVDLMSEKPRSYFQRLYFARDPDYPGVEINYRDPNYLITAGGIFDAGRGSPFINAEHAWARSTTLMPLAEGLDYSHFVRLAGSEDDGDRVNTCVAPGFACGLNPVVPSGIPEPCILRRGNWTFLDFNATAPGCDLKYGYFVVVYAEACDNSKCKSKAGDGGTFGFFEAAVAHSIEQLAEDIPAKNKNWDFRSDKVNVYEGASGMRYTFQPLTADPLKWGMVSIAQGTGKTDFPLDIGKWPLAEGEVMRSNGHEGCVMIDNSLLDQRLVLDYMDANNPKRARVKLSSGGQECRCPLPDSCLPPRYE